MALFERITSTLSRTLIAASIASQVFAPIGRSCGANQQRTPLFCRSAGLLPKETRHRQMKYLNNRLEGDHGKLKRLIKPTLGFESMKTAYATIKGFEVMRMFKKGQFKLWIEAVGGGTEASFVNRLFGVYA
jgi:DDE domain